MASASYSTMPQDIASDHEAMPRGRRPRRSRKEAGLIGTASWLSSVINLLNTIVGAGVLAMPSALSHTGILLGILIILWAGATSAFGLYLQTRCARYLDRGTASFFALSQITYPNAAVVFDAAIAIKCFGVGVSYLIIIGDLMPGVVQGFGGSGDGWEGDRRFWITAFMLIVIPLSFLRRLDSLKYTSVIALISISYLVVLVVYHFGEGDTIPSRGEVRVVKWQGLAATLASFPVIVFAYTCHQNMFSILNEIKDNSPKRTTSVIVSSIGTAASVYILVAITGYLSFGDNVTGNIVSMYPPSVQSTIGRAAIVVLVMFSYPLQAHPCRASLDAVLKWRPNKTPSHIRSSSSPSRHQPLLLSSPANSGVLPSKDGKSDMGETRFAAITTMIIVLSYIVAMTVTSLEKVLAYVGSTGSTSISFILPGLFYYKISSPEGAHHQRLLKENDDAEEDDDEDEDLMRAREGALLSGEAEGEPRAPDWRNWRDWGVWKNWRSRRWRDKMLRRASLALAVYGICVMVVCLGTNTLLVAKPPEE